MHHIFDLGCKKCKNYKPCLYIYKHFQIHVIQCLKYSCRQCNIPSELRISGFCNPLLRNDTLFRVDQGAHVPINPETERKRKQNEELKKLLKDEFIIFSDYYNINKYGYWEDDNYVLIKNKSDAAFAKAHNLSKEEVIELEIPTGAPIIYTFSGNESPISKENLFG